MDFFELLPDSPPPKKKQKVDELGVGLSTDVREESVEKEHGTPEKVQRISTARKRSGNPGEVHFDSTDGVKKLLKDGGFDKDFKVMGSSVHGPTVGCLACMKKWGMKESTSGKHAGPGDSTVDLLRVGNWAPAAISGICIKKFKKTLKRHLTTSSRHQQATGESVPHEDAESAGQDVPSDAQMRIVYDEVKKSPMVPPPCCLGRIAVICLRETQLFNQSTVPIVNIVIGVCLGGGVGR